MARIVHLGRFQVLAAHGRKGHYVVVFVPLGPDLWSWWTRGN